MPPKTNRLLKRLNKNGVRFAPAALNDLQKIKALLVSCDLPSEDIEPHLSNFISAKIDDRIVGAIGFEELGKACLLRSFAVAPSYRSKGIGNELLNQIMTLARKHKIKESYLLTTTIAESCAKAGFKIIDRTNIPEIIQKTKEFSNLCPKTAVCMHRAIS
jgi:N-acetylglutamate synthase-like GNAT family acetyltransferase